MTPDSGPEIASSWTGEVTVAGLEHLPDTPAAYRLMGTEFHGEFDIGVRTLDDGTGPFPLMPADAYSAVTEYVAAELDVDALREQTARNGRREVGRCTLEQVGDETVRLDVDLFEDWREL